MLVLAQEITVNVPADPVGRIVSVVALVVAVLTAGVTYWQGRVIRRIETREHEWQAIDRISASVEVTTHRFRETYAKDGRVHHNTREWLRLRNSGRAPARDVSWEAEIDVLLGNRASLEILHPGEHYDVYYAMSIADPPGWLFTVEWTDDRDRHSTQRRIS